VLRGTGVTAAAGAVGYAVASTSDAADQPPDGAAANGYGSTEETGTRLAALTDIPAGGGLVLADVNVVLVRSASDEVHAFSATCTHQGCTVTSVDGATIFCPCHASRFDVLTGEPVSGPAGSALPPVGVELRADGVYAT
jgi:Rieske Fe-S protein